VALIWLSPVHPSLPHQQRQSSRDTYWQLGERAYSGPTSSHWAVQGGAAPTCNGSFICHTGTSASGARALRLRAEHFEDKLHATQCGDTTS
jgi:hypothetical protein